MSIVINGNGIDMGNNPVSNASKIDSTVINESGDNVATGNREYEAIKEWLADGNTPEPEFTDEELRTKFENEFRRNRDNLLNIVVDHYQKPLVWETLTVDQQDKVRIYRQALLDSTNNWILPEELVL